MASRGINKVILVGNLGKDPEIRYLDQGIAVANFSLATTESFKNKDGNREDRTEWHNIVMWRGLAETAGKYLKKGNSIYLEGRIVTRSWDDQASGQKKYRTEIEASNMIMLDSRPGSGPEDSVHDPGTAYNQHSSSTPSPQPQPQVSADDAADDLPF
ncbi:MAG: single-stranded DNA-binding protein [Bacteroidia bacterium]|nr:single-stranded DNA-binding protein [Bacteroidia bacterium]